MQDSGINDMAQVMNVAINGLRFGVDITKIGLSMAKNLALLIYKAGKNISEKKLLNSKGLVDMKKLLKIDPDVDFVRVEKKNEELFLKLCEQHGIPVAKMDSFNKEDGRVVSHYFYPRKMAPRMNSVMEILKEYSLKNTSMLKVEEGFAKKFEDACKKAGIQYTKLNTTDDMDGKTMNHYTYPSDRQSDMNKVVDILKQEGAKVVMNSKMDDLDKAAQEAVTNELNRRETPEELLLCVGANCPENEFKIKYLEKYPEDMKLFEKKEILMKQNVAVIFRENEAKKKFQSTDNFTITIDQKQIIGKEKIADATFYKVQSPFDKYLALLVDEKDIIKLKDGKFTCSLKKDGDVHVNDLKKDTLNIMSVKDFIMKFSNTNSKPDTPASTAQRAISVATSVMPVKNEVAKR